MFRVTGTHQCQRLRLEYEMYKKVSFIAEGLTPTIMHNGRLANPLNEIVKQMKVITAKRKKTDQDTEDLMKLEWFGGLYLDDKGRPCWPGECIEAGLITAAKRNNLGKVFKAGMVCDGLWPIKYEGPKDMEKLYLDSNFVDFRKARVGTASIMRTRPIFRAWSLAFDVDYMPEMLNESQVIAAAKDLGVYVGLSDNRPRYGKYEITSSKAA